MYTGAAVMEDSMKFLKKLKIELLYDSAIPPWVYIQRKWKH